MRAKDMTGLRFGKKTVIERAGSNEHGAAAWLCRCVDCGRESVVAGPNLRSGLSDSCYCATGKQKHGHSATKTSPRSPTYYSWRAMVKRCENKNEISFKYCGSRGITVCERWRRGDGKRSGFECFLFDMGPRPFGLSLDRADSD